ncbi:lipoate--protein ligase family protein [Paenibacillus marinisediminis]
MEHDEGMLVLDRTNELTEKDVLYPFALDEMLCRRTGQGGPAICHLWRHPRAFVMGQRDSRLPRAAEAEQWLQSLGYETAVRSSGGAAVPLDLGVVNLSLILPKTSQGDLHFHRDFERMYQLIRAALEETGREVDKGEIAGAYCPGDYDLSINGLKFCGIAQRRQSHAFIVQAFVVCSGSGRDSARLVRDFYDRAASESSQGTAAEAHNAASAANASAAEQLEVQPSTAGSHPLVTEGSTASLDELIGLGPDAARLFADAVKRVIHARQTAEGIAAAAASLWLPEPAQVRETAAKLRSRYGISPSE